MACRVLIDSVLVTPLVAGESHLQEITVAGPAEGCARVRVVLQCTESVSYVLDVDENGHWGGRFDVKAALCECGEPSLLVASCADDPECQSDAVEINQRCPTPPGPCPVILNIIPAVSSTCTAGKRSATFTADIRVGATPVPDSAIQFYRWEFGDNSPAVSRTASEGAGPVSVTVPACGCPTVTDIEVTPGDCSGDGTHRSVSLMAIVSGQAEEFVWNFGDRQAATVPTGSGGRSGSTPTQRPAPTWSA